MNLAERTSDALIGVFVAGTLLILLTAIYFTQGWNRRSWQVYITAASAEGLNSDTKVYLQGLEIGRVNSVSPRIGGTGPLTFLVQLTLDQRFANDSQVQIPLGTRALIAEASFVVGSLCSLAALRAAAAEASLGATVPPTNRTTQLDPRSVVRPRFALEESSAVRTSATDRSNHEAP
ncbi:MAG: MlaD family protein, partial [Gemmatimonadota bacterium]